MVLDSYQDMQDIVKYAVVKKSVIGQKSQININYCVYLAFL